MGSHSQAPQNQNALHIIFTCDICQASISDLYHSDDSATDFQDGRSEGSDRRVTSLWLTSCMHLTCGNHLEGGGAPFHPKGEHPQAPCPLCVIKGRDERPRKLYAVRGWEKGSYDDAIPDILFQAPPVQFDGQNTRMEALNFQYQSLLRYGTAVRAKYLRAKEERRNTAAAAKQHQLEHGTLVARNKDLELRMAGLEKDAAIGAKWRAKMPQITHYLSLWPKAMDEIELLRGQLEQLGYAIPKCDYSFKVGQHAESDFSSTGSNRKRKRSPMFKDIPTINGNDGHYPDGMPPPQLLLGGEETGPLREKLINGDRSRHKSQATSRRNDMWKQNNHEVADTGSLVANSGPQQAPEDDFMMTGAIPHTSPCMAAIEKPRPPTQSGCQPLQQDSLPQRVNQSQIPETPRIAAGKQIRQADVGPSHSYRTGIPERQDPRQYDEQVRPAKSLDQPQTRSQDFVRSNKKPEHEHFNRHSLANREAPPGPMTPLPRKFQAPGNFRLPRSGSSPFFKRSHHESAMPGGLSANARMGSVRKNMQNLRMTPAQQGWDKPRTLNGLSFIQDPRGFSNELLSSQHLNAQNGSYDDYSTRLGAVRPTDAGLFKRPELPQQRLSSSCFQNTTLPATSKELSPFQHSARSQLRPSHNPRTLPPSADHEALRIIQSSRNAAPTPSFYQNQIFDRTVDHTPSHSQMESRGLFSSMGGRRSVRR